MRKSETRAHKKAKKNHLKQTKAAEYVENLLELQEIQKALLLRLSKEVQ